MVGRWQNGSNCMLYIHFPPNLTHVTTLPCSDMSTLYIHYIYIIYIYIYIYYIYICVSDTSDDICVQRQLVWWRLCLFIKSQRLVSLTSLLSHTKTPQTVKMRSPSCTTSSFLQTSLPVSSNFADHWFPLCNPKVGY